MFGSQNAYNNGLNNSYGNAPYYSANDSFWQNKQQQNRVNHRNSEPEFNASNDSLYGYRSNQSTRNIENSPKSIETGIAGLSLQDEGDYGK